MSRRSTTFPSTDPEHSVGEVLSVSADHMRGLHGAPRPDCWRCARQDSPDLVPPSDGAEHVEDAG